MPGGGERVHAAAAVSARITSVRATVSSVRGQVTQFTYPATREPRHPGGPARATEVERLTSARSWWFWIEGHSGVGEEAREQIGLLLARA
jgi:hypothetical protein